MNDLEYSVSEDDIINFSHYHALQQPDYKGSLFRHKFIWPGMLVVAGIYTHFFSRSPVLAVVFIFAGMFWSYFVPGIIKKLNGKYALKKSVEKGNSVLGKHTLRLENDYLVDSCNDNETRIKWEDILRVEKTDDTSLIYLGLEVAIVIPKISVTKGTYDKFINKIEKSIRG